MQQSPCHACRPSWIILLTTGMCVAFFYLVGIPMTVSSSITRRRRVTGPGTVHISTSTGLRTVTPRSPSTPLTIYTFIQFSIKILVYEEICLQCQAHSLKKYHLTTDNIRSYFDLTLSKYLQFKQFYDTFT